MNAKATDYARVYEAYKTICETKDDIAELNITKESFCNPEGTAQKVIAEGIENRLFRITEELGSISDDVAAEYVFPTRAAKGVRNRLAHLYGDIDREILWDVIERDFTAVIQASEKYCDDNGLELA